MLINYVYFKEGRAYENENHSINLSKGHKNIKRTKILTKTNFYRNHHKKRKKLSSSIFSDNESNHKVCSQLIIVLQI